MLFQTIALITDSLYRLSEPIGIFTPQFGVKTVNMYLVIGKERAALIDTGMGIGDLRAEIRKLTSLPLMVLNSHYHWDHTGANALFDESAIHQAEVELLAQEPDMSAHRQKMQSPEVRAALPPDFDPASFRIIRKPATRTLRDGDTIDLGGRTLQVIHTPGHSPGHVAYFDESSGALFTADAAYCGPMYACFAGSDPVAFGASAKRLSGLRGVKMLCPGHNDLVSHAAFLSELSDAMDAALSGKIQSGPPNEELKRKEFRFGEFSVWFPL